jgi:hypothetical protein
VKSPRISQSGGNREAAPVSSSGLQPVIDSLGRVLLGKERQVRLALACAAAAAGWRGTCGAGCSAGRQPEPPQPGSAYNC